MKQIPLTQGKFALVDDDDYEYLNQFSWFYQYGYASRTINYHSKNKKKSIVIKMHREIMSTPKGFDTDHINHNRLDNRKSNLRICTRYENVRNTGINSANTSGYKGVHYHRKLGKWVCRICVSPNKRKHVGYYFSKEEAAKAYNEAALKYYGEFACLNKI